MKKLRWLKLKSPRYSIIPTLREAKQEDCKFKPCLDKSAKSYLKKRADYVTKRVPWLDLLVPEKKKKANISAM